MAWGGQQNASEGREKLVMAIRGRESANRRHERAHEVLVKAKSANSCFKIFLEAAKEHEEALRMAITAEFV